MYSKLRMHKEPFICTFRDILYILLIRLFSLKGQYFVLLDKFMLSHLPLPSEKYNAYASVKMHAKQSVAKLYVTD